MAARTFNYTIVVTKIKPNFWFLRRERTFESMERDFYKVGICTPTLVELSARKAWG